MGKIMMSWTHHDSNEASSSLADIARHSLIASDNVTFVQVLGRFPGLNPDRFLEDLARRTIALTRMMQDRKNDTMIRVWIFLHEQGYKWLNLPDVFLLIVRLRRYGYIPEPKRRRGMH